MQPLEVAVTRSGHAVAGARTIEASEILENLELKHTYVEYESDDLYWKYVNAAVLSVVLESYFSAKAVYPALSGYAQYRSWNHTTAAEFFRRDEVVSIRISHHWYGTGAAHSNQSISSLNFLGRNYGRLNIADLLDNNLRLGRELMSTCFNEIVLRNANEHEEPAPTLVSLKELQDDVWSRLAQFNFDDNGIVCSISPLRGSGVRVWPPGVLRPLEFPEG